MPLPRTRPRGRDGPRPRSARLDARAVAPRPLPPAAAHADMPRRPLAPPGWASTHPAMSRPGRPRGFDRDAALAAAMEASWARGHDATTHGALEAATGLRRRSLIYACGDEEAMFARAVALQAERRVAEIVAILRREESGLGNIGAVLDE